MAFGLTSAGFAPKLVGDVEADIDAGMRGNVNPNIDLSPDQPLGQMKSIVATKAAELWELGRVVYSGINPNNAEGFVLDGVCAYTGTKRASATKSHVVCAMGMNATSTVPAGSTANVAGQPTNTWTLLGKGDPTTGLQLTSGAVVSTGAGTYYGYFAATSTGPVAANAGTLTQITNSVTGWNSVTNAADAILGTDIESDTDLQIKREAELAAAGGPTVDGMRADLLSVPGVIQAFVTENTTDVVDADGLPPHSVHVVIYDGAVPQALNANIAKTIWSDKGSGIQTVGVTSVQTPDSTGTLRTVLFDRASPLRYYVALTVKTDSTFDVTNGPTAVKNALKSLSVTVQNLGVNVVALRLRAAALSVQGVSDVPAFALDITPAPTATGNIAVTGLQIATLDTGDIGVTVT